MGDLSPHFSRSEFACQGKVCCGNSAPVDTMLIDGLEKLRAKLPIITGIQTPLTISSGFRCNIHNTTVGGATNSQHTFGTACDVMCPDGLTVDQFFALAELIPCFAYGGIGRYSNRLHLDVRTNGPARWDKRK